ncbi:MAG: hypothetical protein AB1489_25915, partial [Acidobacteriota bacterium]
MKTEKEIEQIRYPEKKEKPKAQSVNQGAKKEANLTVSLTKLYLFFFIMNKLKKAQIEWQVF